MFRRSGIVWTDEQDRREEQLGGILGPLFLIGLVTVFPLGAIFAAAIARANLANLGATLSRFISNPVKERYTLYALLGLYFLCLKMPWFIDKKIIGHLAETNAFGGKVADAVAWAATQPLLVQIYVSIDRLL